MTTTTVPGAPPTIVPASAESQLERDLARSKQGSFYLKTALDQVSEGVLILMPEQGGQQPYVMHGNATAHVLAGVEPSAGLRERTLGELAADEAAAVTLRNALQRAREQGGSASCVCALRAGLGGKPRQFEWNVRAVVTEHGELLNYTLCFKPVEAAGEIPVAPPAEEGKSVTDRLRTENLAALAQGIAHDVNNLLGPVMGQLSLTLQRTETHPEVRGELEMMFAALKRARQFTQQVVRTVRTRSEERMPVNLGKLVKESLPVYTAGSNIEVKVCESLNLMWVNANAVQISQVLQNLVMNGMQAMPQGGMMFVELANAVIPEGNAEGLKAGDYVEIKVRDRGTGMTPEVLGRLFKESFTTKEEGSGIGLTTCRRFVLDHGGHIGVESALNVGTEFRVLLPAVPPQTHLEDAADHALIPLQEGEGVVMLVEDEPPLRHVARCILNRCGYEVIEAENGEQALRMYREQARKGHKPDVVLMDLTLPGGLTGGETAQAILRIDPAAKLVVTSGSVTEDSQRAYMEEGFSGVLAKPYEAGALTLKVRDVMQMKILRRCQAA